MYLSLRKRPFLCVRRPVGIGMESRKKWSAISRQKKCAVGDKNLPMHARDYACMGKNVRAICQSKAGSPA